jgi:hypothetical protein
MLAVAEANCEITEETKPADADVVSGEALAVTAEEVPAAIKLGDTAATGDEMAMGELEAALTGATAATEVGDATRGADDDKSSSEVREENALLKRDETSGGSDTKLGIETVGAAVVCATEILETDPEVG